MTEDQPASAGAEVTIDADPEAVYAMITDLTTLAALADEAEAMWWCKGTSAEAGSVFKGRNRNGSRSWTTTCTVTAAERGRVFAFDVKSVIFPVSHWRYDIEPVDGGGCRVRERTWDRRAAWFRIPAKLATGVADRRAANAAHIETTLKRLKDRAERPVAG